MAAVRRAALVVLVAAMPLAGCRETENKPAPVEPPSKSGKVTLASLKPGSVISREVPGTYSSLTASSAASLVGAMPLKNCGTELTAAQEKRIRLLAQYLATFCASGDESLTGAHEIETNLIGFSFEDDLRDRRANSPNMNWESLNTGQSYIAVGEPGSDCADLKIIQGMMDRRGVKPTEGVRLVVIHFEVGHLTGAKNMVAFNFEERPGGSFVHFGLTVSNLLTLPE